MGALRSESKAGGAGRAATHRASAPLAAALAALLLFGSLQTEERREDDLGMLGQSNAGGAQSSEQSEVPGERCEAHREPRQLLRSGLQMFLTRGLPEPNGVTLPLGLTQTSLL